MPKRVSSRLVLLPLRLAKLPAHWAMMDLIRSQSLFGGFGARIRILILAGEDDSRRRVSQGYAVLLGHVEAGPWGLGLESGRGNIANLARSCDRRAFASADEAVGMQLS
jgi:hypothetical protein